MAVLATVIMLLLGVFLHLFPLCLSFCTCLCVYARARVCVLFSMSIRVRHETRVSRSANCVCMGGDIYLLSCLFSTNVSDSDTEWRKQSRKRKRNETGSVDLDAFTKMSPDEKLIALFTKLMTVEDKKNILRSVMSPVHEKVDILEDCVNIHERKIKMLSYRSLDLEARSRRNNLIFRGLADVAGENCTDIIVDFLSEEMAMEISPIVIARAHRLGSLQRFRSRQHVSRRPIIVAFKDYSLTEQIMTNARRLRGTNFRVEKDFPAEIAEARKNLWPKLKAEKSKNPTCRVTIAYPAKLIRNNSYRR